MAGEELSPMGDVSYLPVPVQPPAGSLDLIPATARLIEMFLSGRSPQTVRAYAGDLADFARFAGADSNAAAAARLLAGGAGQANGMAFDFRADLLRRGLSAATINRRLAALRSLTKLGRLLGLVGWSLEVEGVRSENYRDTRGPGRDGVRRLLAALADRQDAKGVRDRALLRLLYDLGLRRAEAVGIDLEDVDREAGTVAVLGKGRTQKVALTLPEPTQEALNAWLAVRGTGPGALFHRLDSADKGKGRLAGAGVYDIIVSLGRRTGLRVRPHGLRHAAITEALDLTGGDIRAVQRFSRHRDVRTIGLYDDNRTDLAGIVARKVSGTA
jgi:integrase/recombinase XerC